MIKAPVMPIHDIASALYRAGLREEYDALKVYIAERDALYSRIEKYREFVKARAEQITDLLLES